MSPTSPASGHDGGSSDRDEVVVARTRLWLERAVIGLNLCPFAQPVHAQDRIRYCVSRAKSEEALMDGLAIELEMLRTADPDRTETTLLIHPDVLAEFPAYNQFLDGADDLLRRLRLDGVIQIASFHPHYRFDDTDPEDITNNTNRSPYPMLHLLRESSVARAVSGTEDAARIVDRNIATLRALGPEGWKRLGISSPGSPDEPV